MSIAMIVGGGGFQGLPVLRGLHAIGWRTLVADSVPESLNRFETDVFSHVSEVKYYEAFSMEVLRLVEHHGVEAVFSTTMYDLPALAKLRPKLEQLGARVFVSSPDLVALLSDKSSAMSAAQAVGLPVLPIVDPASHDFSSPLIGKPTRGWGGIGIVIATNMKEWKEASKTKPIDTYLWQRKLEDFCEWSVDFALQTDGSCSPRVSRRRLRTTGGFSVISEVDESQDVDNLALDTAKWLANIGGCGVFNIQFLQEPDGTLWLNDINPRPGTSSVCALTAGVNLVGFLLRRSNAVSRPRPGIIIRTLQERFLPHLEHEIKGIVFDLDETLICQKRWMQGKLEIVTTALQDELDPSQLSAFHLEALRVIDEGPWPNLIDIALARSDCPSTLADKLITCWRSANPDTIFIYQDATALLYALQAIGMSIALLSDNPAASQWQKIAKLPEDIRFKSIVLTDEISSSKPDTKGFLAVAEGLCLPPENLLMIGDSPWRDGLGAIRSGYGGALIIRRSGSMSNPLQSIFIKEFPDVANRISWSDSLYGVDRMLRRGY